MERVYLTAFQVTGRGQFPVDMLRYDQAWPTSSDDAASILRSFNIKAGSYRDWTVKLTMVSRSRTGGPTVDRWKSFGCQVTLTEK